MYPIRVSRPIWSQPFIKPHICSELCNTQYQISDNLIRITYQTGCLFPENIEPIHIHISNHTDNFDYSDNILNIPNEVSLYFHHPIKKPFVKLHSFDKVVIRLSDVIRVFDEIYKKMYKEEEEQATKKDYEVEKICPDCDDEYYTEEKLPEYLVPLDTTNLSEYCSICFETLYPGDDNIKLYKIHNCQHIFHQQCILKWFKTPKVVNQDETIPTTNSCPICRQAIIYCNTCKGTTTIKEKYFGSVPPYDPTSDDDRVETDGPYGIHTIYYEELYFKGIVYDRIHNTISLLPLEDVSENVNETEETND
jgi:hypothetical protein